jgi:hypothetical protein
LSARAVRATLAGRERRRRQDADFFNPAPVGCDTTPEPMIQRRVLLLIVVFSFVAAASSARAQRGGDFGLGIIIGDPTGLSGKGFVSETNAIDFAVGLAFIGNGHLQVHADYLWHFDIKRWSSAQLDLHLGVGPKLGLRVGDRDGPPGSGPGRGRRDGWVGIGARAPFGLTMRFFEAPFDVFVEIAAGLWLVPKPDFDLDAAIGGRYWF